MCDLFFFGLYVLYNTLSCSYCLPKNGNPLQYPCLENLMDRGAWRAAVHGVAKSRARLSDKHLLSDH